VEQVAEEARRANNREERKREEQTCAAAEIVRRVMEAPGQITVIGLGPLTNIALALAGLSLNRMMATMIRKKDRRHIDNDERIE